MLIIVLMDSGQQNAIEQKAYAIARKMNHPDYRSDFSKRKDHFVPQLILRKFASKGSKKNKKIWILNKVTKEIRNDYVQDIAFKYNLENLSLAKKIEQSGIENHFRTLIDSLEKRGYLIKDEEKNIYFNFVILNYLRSPWFEQYNRSKLEEKYHVLSMQASDIVEKMVFRDTGSERFKLTEKSMIVALKELLEEGRLLKFFCNECSIKFQHSKNSIAISDNFVIPIKTNKISSRENYSFSKSLFLMPLSPNLISIFGHKDLLKRKKNHNNVFITDRQANYFNQIQLEFANEEIYSHEEGLLKNIKSENLTSSPHPAPGQIS